MDSIQSEQPVISAIDVSQTDTEFGAMGADNIVLALYVPRLPEATSPVVGAHYGVPLRIYDMAPMGPLSRLTLILGSNGAMLSRST